MKRGFYWLAIILLNILMPVVICAQFSAGGGTEENPYKITSEVELIPVLDYCGEQHANKHFRLMNDITLSATWTPIGDINNKFTGYFHGGGHTISGLRINNRDSNYAGLFGYVKGTIDSLFVEGTTIKGGQYVGGLAGYNEGTITFCHIDVSVDGTSNSAAAYAGGLAGYNKGIVQSSSAKGDIKASGSTAAYAGGLIGYTDNSDITNCFAQGIDIEASAFGTGIAYSGGLVGYLNSSGSVIDCYTTGIPSTIIGIGGQYAGAVVGYNRGNISNCYYNISNTGTMPATGNNVNGNSHGQTSNGMKTKDVYVGWDFNAVWGIKEGVEYPYLRRYPLGLEYLTVNSGTLTTAFHPDTLNYTVDVNTNSIKIKADVNNTNFPGATISGTDLDIALITGKNPAPVTVKHDGGELVYTVNVHFAYTLNFDAQGGSVNPSSQTITSGTNILPVPARTGYDFQEWNTKPAGDSIAFDDFTVQNASGLTTLYAQWKPKEYILYFDAGEGSVSPASKTVRYGFAVGDLPQPTRTGYNFDNWNTQSEPDGITDTVYTSDTVYRADADKTLYAQWTAKSYKLHFNINYAEGTNPPDGNVTYGNVVGTLPTPARSGYTFGGWNTKSDGTGETYTSNVTLYTATVDITLHAQWTANTYTLSFNAQGGTPDPSNREIIYGESVGDLPILDSREHYTFKGWNTKPDGNGKTYSDNEIYNIDSDTTFYAIWKGDQYKISFDINYPGGTKFAEQTVDYGSAVGNLPPLVRAGYTGEWNTHNDGSGTTYTSSTVYYETQSITLFAHWTAKQYKLTYDAQGGTVDPAYKFVYYGNAVGELPTPARENYNFQEWNALSDGTGDTYTNAKIYNKDGDITIYARWNAKSSILSFDAQGGIVYPTEKIVYYGSAVGALPDPERPGYEFEGWFTEVNGNDEYISTTPYMKTVNITLYAKWNAKTYHIDFNSNYNGGPNLSTETKFVTYGIAVGDLSYISVTRPNYVLNGWNTMPDGTGKTYDENTIYNVAGNILLYAQWKGKSFTITFITNESDVPDPQPETVSYGSQVGTLPTDIRPGYTNIWKDNQGTIYNANTTVTGDVTLYAQWTAKEYNLTFNTQGGTVSPTSKTVTYEAAVGTLPSPTRPGYTFGEWYTEVNGSGTLYTSSTTYSVAGNTTVYAKWNGNPYKLGFNSQGGSNTGSDITVIFGTPVGTLSDPGTRTYYTFIGWNTESNGSGTTYTATTNYAIVGNATLYAIWQGESSTLTFEPESGTVNPTTKTVYYNTPVGALPTPKRLGYAFKEWNTAQDGSGTKYTVETVYTKTGNTTTPLYAQWTERKYKISFNTNYSGGESFLPVENINYNSTIDELPVPSSRLYYTFLGWNTAQNGSGVDFNANDSYKFDDDITLYAKWIGETCKIIFESNYIGSAITPQEKSVYYGASVGDIFPGFSRQGYQLTGWNTVADGSGKNYDSDTKYEEIPKEITLYAQWTARNYILYFDAQGGSVSPAEKAVTYFAAVGALPNPALAGHTFKEWNTASGGNGSGTKYDPETIYNVVGNTTLYAQWTMNKYTLTFDSQGGIPVESIQVDYNSLLTLPDASRAGYTFTEWNTAKNGSGTAYATGDTYAETQHRILYAQWKANVYTITFKNNGGGKIEPATKPVTYGTQTGTLPETKRTGYDFVGWDTQEDGEGDRYDETRVYLIPHDTTLYAQWSAKSYTITFDANGGNVVSPASKTVIYDSKLGTLPVPTRTGHIFTGWNTDRNGNGTTYEETDIYYESDNTVLYAQWDIAKYTLTYDAGGGTVPAPAKDKPYGTVITLPGSSRTGYTHAGWNTEAYGSGTQYNVNDVITVTQDETLYAQWTANSYTIGFEANYTEGTNPSDQNVTYDAAVGLLPALTRTGYTFGGWNTLASGDGITYSEDKVYTTAGNITLYAKWTAHTYTLSFDAQGGGYVTDKSVIYDAQVGELTNPVRKGYTFGGWFTEADGEGEQYFASTVYKTVGNTTLYAQWTANVYTLSFDTQGGTPSISSRQVTYDTPAGDLTEPARTGYTFGGWFTEADGGGEQYFAYTIYKANNNITLYARWTANTYTLGFDAQGGVTVADKLVTYGTKVGELTDPVRKGYTFGGWFTETNGGGEQYFAVTVYGTVGNTTLYAKWTAKTYTLGFDAQGGGAVSAVEAEYDAIISLPGVARAGYTFKEWNTLEKGNGIAFTGTMRYTKDGDMTLYAQWNANVYTLIFDEQGGNPVNDLSVTYDATIDPLPVPTRAGYTFAGWFTGTGGGGNEYTASVYTTAGNTTLYAYWTANSYVLAFNINYGGGVNPGNQNVVYDSKVMSLPSAGREGYVFKGWNTAKDGSGTTYSTETVYTEAGNTTLYAQWTAGVYTISFNANYAGGVNPSPQNVVYNAAAGQLPSPVRTGYTFKGWNTGTNGNGTVYTAETVYTTAGNITLYAQWDINYYTVSFDVNYASTTVLPDNTVTYGAPVGTLPAVPDRTGYTLTGWNTQKDGSGNSYDENTVYTTLGNITLYAQWTPNVYTISFDTQGGAPESDYSVRYNVAVGNLPVPVRTGYTFGGWFTGKNGSGEPYTGVTIYNRTDNIILYAKWTVNSYTVSFNANYIGGINPPDQNVTYDAAVGFLPSPARTGYTFKGWNTQANGDGITYSEDKIYTTAGNTTLYAQWTINKYTLTFDAQGGNAAGAIEAVYNAVVSLPQSTRTGYTFNGWNTLKDGSGITYSATMQYTKDSDVTLYAQWTVNVYTLNFDVQGGSPVNSQSVTYDAATGSLPVPVRTGYTFGGWFTGINGGGHEYTSTTVYAIAGNTTLYAKWTANTYVLEFNVNYSGGVNPAKQDVTYDKSIVTLPVVTRPGYVFKEWNAAQDGSGTKYTAGTVYTETGNTVLYAQWTVNSYTISFDANYLGGINPSDQNVTYDAAVGLLPSLTRTGYVFKGWNTAKDGSGVTYTETTAYTVAGNAVMYAQWAGNSYVLNFDVQGGVSIADHQVVYGAAVGTLPVTSRDNYTFGGWFTGINGGGTEYVSTTVYSVTGNTVLYANWIANTYVIHFDVQGGSTVSSLPVTYNNVVGTLPVPVRTGYTFNGWNTDKDGSGMIYTETVRYTVSGNTSLYAQWTANSYKLSFDTQSDDIIDDQTVIYDSVVGKLPLTTRPGYVFEGWYSGTNGGGTKYTSTTVYTVAGNTTLYVNWIANRYILSFDINCAGTAVSNPEGREVTYGLAVGAKESLPVPAREGYIFKGWNTEIDGSGTTYISTTVYTVTGNITLYAQWTANIYTLSFDVNYLGGASPEPQNIVYGAAVGKLPVLARTGYIFTGWNTAANGSGENYTEIVVYRVAGNTTLYAQWTGINYTVSFTGDNVDLDPQTVVHGAKVVKPSDPTLQGYVFGGWYKDNALWDFNTPVTGNLLLTAKWVSSDTKLSNLIITQGTLSPEFKPSITDYMVKLSYNIATINVTGIPNNSGASVTGNVENKSLAVGTNVIKIIVTAEDGVNTMIYTIVITREDHILVSEANLLSLSAGGRQVTIEGNRLEYAAACGETSFALKLDASPYAKVFVDGALYYEGQVIEMTGEITTVAINVISETGAVKEYTLKACAAIDESRLYYKRWPDILGINANPDNNGGYEVTGVRWYRYDGAFAGSKGYIETSSSMDYAEIQTVQKEGWRRVCGIPATRTTEKITVYPNPVPSGESVKLELPEQYAGGTLNIYDITGALIKSGLPLPSTTNTIDVTGFSSGIYLFNITGKNGNRQSVKIIVE
jgi:uncharacterized repeat protein (TIGR02543 family)